MNKPLSLRLSQYVTDGFFLQNLTPGVLPPLPRPVDDYTLGDIVLGTPKIVEDCEADGKHLDDYLPVCPSTSCHLSIHFITSMTFELFFFCLIVHEINEFFITSGFNNPWPLSLAWIYT